MNELNLIETHSNLNTIPLSNQTKFRLIETNKIKDYLKIDIQERKTMSKKLSKFIAAFDYIDKTVTALLATRGVSIFSNYRSNKETVKDNKKQKKKHNKIDILAKSKLNSIETLMSQALIDLGISHGEFKTIVNEKEKYEQMKENIKNAKISDEKVELNANIRKNSGNKNLEK